MPSQLVENHVVINNTVFHAGDRVQITVDNVGNGNFTNVQGTITCIHPGAYPHLCVERDDHYTGGGCNTTWLVKDPPGGHVTAPERYSYGIKLISPPGINPFMHAIVRSVTVKQGEGEPLCEECGLPLDECDCYCDVCGEYWDECTC